MARKRKDQEKLIDMHLDQVNSLSSLALVRSLTDRKLHTLMEIPSSARSRENKDDIKLYFLLQKRINMVLPTMIQSALEEQEYSFVPEHEKTDIIRYRYLSSFILSAIDIPHVKGYQLLQKLGYYSKDNPGGVVKDHRISIKVGFENKMKPEILAHPVNCEFLTVADNVKKSANCSLTIPILYEEIAKWDQRTSRKTRMRPNFQQIELNNIRLF